MRGEAPEGGGGENQGMNCSWVLEEGSVREVGEWRLAVCFLGLLCKNQDTCDRWSDFFD